MTDTTTTEPTEHDEQTELDETVEPEQPATDADELDARDDDDEPSTYTNRDVRKLRDEAKKHRLKARERQYEVDRLNAELWEARVALTDTLQDPSDLPFDPDLLGDPAGIAAAARALVAEKPYMGKHRTRSDIGQHETAPADGWSLAGALRSAAGA